MQVKSNQDFRLSALLAFIALLALSYYIFLQNQAVAITEAHQLKDSKLQCVSYAPYYQKGDSPIVEGMWIEPAQIEHDLQLLSSMSHCVRTYSVSQGMDYVPEAAAKLGLNVYLGAWVGWTDADNIKEIKLAAETANAYPNIVKGLIVGNEVLLRGEQDELAMRNYFLLAKSLTNIPITYADVWEFWIKHKSLAQYVDFHTVHILPYWEDNPVAIEDATQHAEYVMQKLQSIFNKPILIGETGWPSVGRQRSGSSPSLVNQAQYIRAFVNKADDKGWQYNIIEAIDQPWKKSLEGTVGGYWGLMTFDLVPKFAFTGPVSERHDHYRFVWIGLIGGLLIAGFAYYLGLQHTISLAGLGFLGAFGSMMSYLNYAYVISVSRAWVEWIGLGGLAVIGLMMLLLYIIAQAKTNRVLRKILQIGKLIIVCAALVTGYLLYFDGRYRDFPIVLFALPVLLMLMDKEKPKQTLLNWLGIALPVSLAVMFAVLCYIKESNNSAAISWLGLTLLLAFTSWPRSKKQY